MGKQTKEYFASQGRENSLEEFRRDSFAESSIYTFAWTGEVKESVEHEAIVEWTVCPIADGFKAYGEEGVEIGELFCHHIDNAIISGFNPDYICVRESSIYKTGLCRLHMKLKD